MAGVESNGGHDDRSLPHVEYSIQTTSGAEQPSGEVSLHALATQHRVSPNLIGVWLKKYATGEFTEETALAALPEEYQFITSHDPMAHMRGKYLIKPPFGGLFSGRDDARKKPPPPIDAITDAIGPRCHRRRRN